MIDSTLITYCVLIGLLTITPGADTMLTLRNVFSSGKRAGMFTALGINSGLLVYGLLSALGISVLITRSLFLYQSVKLVGALYLIYLGMQSLLPVIRKIKEQTLIKSEIKQQKRGDKKAYTAGLLSNLFNPKIAVFYLTVLPQFIGPRDNVFLKSIFLASIHVIMGFIWLSVLSLFIGSIRYFYTSPKVQHSLEAISGTVMILLGIFLIFERK